MTEISSLPLEIFERILKSTEGHTLVQCKKVSKDWNSYINENESLWKEMCKKEFKFSSKIAKQKTGSDMSWYQIYRNLKMWSKFGQYERNLRKFYHFTMHDKCHALGIENSILPLREAKGMILYDMKHMKYIPVALPEKNCLKISHNDVATVVLIKSGIVLQRSVLDKKFATEAFFKADKFVLTNHNLYFFNDRNVFKCDLRAEKLQAELLTHCDYDIWEIQYSDGDLHLFTDCGKIVSITDERLITVKPINCPEEWIKSIKHIIPYDDKNFICYSRNLFKLETDQYKHLYLDFPFITALFFYGEVVILGTKAGEILLYRMSSQKRANKPIFEKIAVLPEQKFAVTLDVYERNTGPVIVASTFFEMFILNVEFFPEETNVVAKKGQFANKLDVYKRLLKLKERLRDANWNK